MQPSTVKDELKAAQKALAELQDELTQFQALLSENERDAESKKRERANLDDQAQAKNRVLVAREMLAQHRADIQAAEVRVSELQARSDEEDLLEVVTQASVRYPEIRAELDKLFAETDAALLTAIQRAADLAAEGNQHLVMADQAVRRILGKGHGQPWYGFDGAARSELYDAAVAGTDVPSIQYTAELQRWPADYGNSPYKTLGHFNPDRTGLTMQHGTPIVDSADTEFDALRDAAMSEMLGGAE